MEEEERERKTEMEMTRGLLRIAINSRLNVKLLISDTCSLKRSILAKGLPENQES